MMKLKNTLIALLILLSSCSQKVPSRANMELVDFGDGDYYAPFLWVKKDTTILKKTLRFDFNEHAIAEGAHATFQIVDQNGTPICSSGENIELYCNNKYCPEGKFSISTKNLPEDNLLHLGLKFLPGSNQGNMYGYLSIENHNIDRVGDFDLHTDNRIVELKANYNERYNPLLLGFFLTTTAITLFLIIWFAILRNIVYPKIKSGKIQVCDPYFKSLKVKGTRRVVFCDCYKPQSSFDRVWRGKILFDSNPIWSKNIVITPGSKPNQVRYKLPLSYKLKCTNKRHPSLQLEKYEKYEIQTDKKTTVIIQYQ